MNKNMINDDTIFNITLNVYDNMVKSIHDDMYEIHPDILTIMHNSICEMVNELNDNGIISGNVLQNIHVALLETYKTEHKNIMRKF